jgi:hypothetical protein
MRRFIKTSSARAITLSVCFFITATFAVLCGCAKPGQQPAETTSQPRPAQPPPAETKKPEPKPEPQKAHEMGPPTLSEVQSAVARVYGGTVTLDTNRFLAGDLDGDSSQDLVAVVKPVAAMLPDINSELARWKIEDPRKVFVPTLVASLRRKPTVPAPVFADRGDVLMVVIHGHGASGWRDPEAMNTYLLKNAVGSGITLQTMKEALAASRGKNRSINLRGDVIKQTLGGEAGYLFWTGVDYAWHSLQNNKTTDKRPAARLATRS